MNVVEKNNNIDELDVLRGLSVCLIFIYHLNPQVISGAIYSLDIFFFVSGYIIVRSLRQKHIASGKVPYRRFFHKRILRIFPALNGVLFGVLFYGLLILSPDDLKELARLCASAILSIVNFFLAADNSQFGGYFSTVSKLTVILHLWSTALEEQFYIIIGLIYFVLNNKYLFIKYLLLLLFAILYFYSFVIDYSLLDIKAESASYYLFNFRSAPFILGGFLYTVQSVWKVKLKLNFNQYILMRAVAFTCLCYPILFRINSVHHLSLSLLTSLGVSLVILSCDDKYSSLFLKNKVLKKIGVMSYAIYLVHWPVISFGFHHTLDDKSLSFKIYVILITLVLASLVHFKIEKPMMFSSGSKNNNLKLKMTLLCSLFIFVFSVLIFNKNGFPQRLSKNLSASYKFNSAYMGHPSDKICFERMPGQCKKIYDSAIYIIGDSYTYHITYGFEKEFPNSNFIVFFNSNCSILMPGISSNKEFTQNTNCMKINSHMTRIIKKYKPKMFLTAWYEKTLYDIKGSISTDSFVNHLIVLSKIGQKILITNTIPRFKGHYEGYYSILDICVNVPSTKFIRPINCKLEREIHNRKIDAILKKYPDLLTKYKIEILDYVSPFCNGTKSTNCKLEDKDGLYLGDSNHLSNLGSLVAVRYFKKLLTNFINH